MVDPKMAGYLETWLLQFFPTYLYVGEVIFAQKFIAKKY